MDELKMEAMFVEAFSELKKHFNKYIKNVEDPFRQASNDAITLLDKEIQGIIYKLENMPEGQSDAIKLKKILEGF